MKFPEDFVSCQPTHWGMVKANPLLFFVSDQRSSGLAGFKAYQKPRETDPIIIVGEA